MNQIHNTTVLIILFIGYFFRTGFDVSDIPSISFFLYYGIKNPGSKHIRPGQAKSSYNVNIFQDFLYRSDLKLELKKQRIHFTSLWILFILTITGNLYG